MTCIETRRLGHLNSQLWNSLPSQWHLIGSPLRPVEQDAEIIMKTLENVRDISGYSTTQTALLLGVTPEIATLNWPAEFKLLAVDRSPGMIAAVWPGDEAWRSVTCADWLSLPFPDNSFDFVVGDGCLVLMHYPDEYRRLSASLRQCLRSEGVLMLRIFCRPTQVESVDDVFMDIQKRAIGSFDAFKWRLIMAVQGDDVAGGALLADVWRVWRRYVPDPQIFAQEQGWSFQKVQVIDTYHDSPTRYHYPTLEEVCKEFGDDFELAWSQVGEYELAERCPHVMFRPKRA